MPRIPYLNENSLEACADLVASIKVRRPQGRLLNLDRILLYSLPVTQGWQTMFSKLRNDLSFSGALRELIILRVALLNRASYEFAQHHPEALKEGLSQQKIDALENWQDSTLFNQEEQAVLAYTDAMTQFVQVPDSIYANLSNLFDDQQLVEITALISGYNMVSRFLEALEINIEGESYA